MSIVLTSCPHCGTDVPVESGAGAGSRVCPNCQATVAIRSRAHEALPPVGIRPAGFVLVGLAFLAAVLGHWASRGALERTLGKPWRQLAATAIASDRIRIIDHYTTYAVKRSDEGDVFLGEDDEEHGRAFMVATVAVASDLLEIQPATPTELETLRKAHPELGLDGGWICRWRDGGPRLVLPDRSTPEASGISPSTNSPVFEPLSPGLHLAKVPETLVLTFYWKIDQDLALNDPLAFRLRGYRQIPLPRNQG